jgi:HEAT repeat protein
MTISNSTKQFLLAASLGAVLTYGLVYLTDDNYSTEYDQVAVLENRIHELDILLAQKDEELTKLRGNRLENTQQNALNLTSDTAQRSQNINQKNLEQIADGSTNSVHDTQRILKDLATRNDLNPRTFSERINDFLSANPGKENIALATKAVVDMADNSDSLPDFELEAVYQKQNDPDLKRVTAQVLSMRGDNSLLEKQIAESQASLSSDNPEVRQKTLVALAKTHYAGAADKIAPLLQDKNVSVKLDALLALRATGNESHVHFVQDLVSHPDPSVSWLAKDVIENIQNLSEKARTKVSTNDIVSELPPIANLQ